MLRETAAIAVASLFAFGASSGARAADAATATLMNAEGQEIGRVEFGALAAGGVHLTATAEGLPPGVHGFHLHETGECEGADGFQSAGGHFNPTDRQHGWNNPEGPHAGDMPNVHVPESGALAVEYFVPDVSLDENAEATLLDEDGTAVMIHSGADDYETDPAGDAGDRIACGVIEAN